MAGEALHVPGGEKLCIGWSLTGTLYLFVGSLVKNRFLMRYAHVRSVRLDEDTDDSHCPARSLIADICNMPVQLPYSHSASVVLGSAMLGCAAFEEATRLQNAPLDKQEAAEKSSFGMKERLWNVMVRLHPFFRQVRGIGRH